jgi:hypothetical protein
MIAYAAYTTNRRSLAAVRGAGWRVLLSPATGLRNYDLPYALDNGAWSAHIAGTPFREEPFRAAVGKIGANAVFVVAPDIVGGGLESLAMTLKWMDWLLERVPVVLIAVQDGMRPGDVRHLLEPRVGVFVGGTTEFKEETMATWASLAHSCGTICHVGRVNTKRRIFLCAAAGADSFDGSSVSRFAKTLPRLDHARKQIDLFGGNQCETPMRLKFEHSAL